MLNTSMDMNTLMIGENKILVQSSQFVSIQSIIGDLHTCEIRSIPDSKSIHFCEQATFYNGRFNVQLKQTEQS